MLILSDVAKIIWGTQQKSVSRPPELTGAFHVFGATVPHYNLFILLLGPAHRARLLVRAAAHARRAASSGPPRSTARRWARSASTWTALYTGVFVLASFLGGLGGALIAPDARHRRRAWTPR